MTIDFEQTLEGLRGRHEALLQEAREIRDSVDNAEDLDEKRIARLEAINDEVETTRARLERMGRLAKAAKYQDQVESGPGPGRQTDPWAGEPTDGAWLPRVAQQGKPDSWAAQMFGPPQPQRGELANWGEFGRAVFQRDARLTMTTGEGSGGGYAVPSPLANELFDQCYQAGLIWPRCKQYNMTSGSLSLWGVDAQSASSNTLYGNVTAKWVGEGDSATAADINMRAVTLYARKLFLLTKTSSELVADAGPQFERQLVAALTNAGSWFLDHAVVNGTGAGMPLGVMNAPCKIAQDKEGGQADTTIVSENVINMWSRLHPSCAANAIWLCNPDCLPQLFAMVVAGASSDVPVWLPMNQSGSGPSLAASPPLTLFGRPLVVTDHSQTLGTEGDIILFDPTQYALGLRKMIGVDSSIHPDFSSDLINWRMILRVDGMPLWDEAYTKAHGSDTQSCVVTLQTRSS